MEASALTSSLVVDTDSTELAKLDDRADDTSTKLMGEVASKHMRSLTPDYQ